MEVIKSQLMEVRKIQLRYFIIGSVLLAMFLFLNLFPISAHFRISPESLWVLKYVIVLISMFLRIAVVYISMHICERLDCGIFWIILIGLIAILIPGLALIVQYLLKPREWLQKKGE